MGMNLFSQALLRQEAYARELVSTCKDAVDLHFPGAAKNREEIEQTVAAFNAANLDRILIVLLAYSQGAWILRALQDNRLPIALAIVQPDQVVGSDWEDRFNGEPGDPRGSRQCQRYCTDGHPVPVFAGNRHEKRFKTFVEDFGKRRWCAQVAPVAGGNLSAEWGMGDILTDDMEFFAKIGPESSTKTWVPSLRPWSVSPTRRSNSRWPTTM